MDKKLTPGEIIIIAAGAVMLIASFLDWYDVPEGFSTGSAWGDFAFPLATLIPLIGVLMALQIVLTKFANVNLPERPLDFTWVQIHLVLAVWAAVMALCWLIMETGLDKGIGFFLNLLGAIGLVAGAVMMRTQPAGSTAGATGGIPPGTYAPPPSSPPPPPASPPPPPPPAPPPPSTEAPPP